MSNKAHLPLLLTAATQRQKTQEGLNLIRTIKSGMNTAGRRGLENNKLDCMINFDLHESPKRVSVKEQRVDGSWFFAQQARNLRCTLMGGASYYQINYPSKQFKSYFSTLHSDSDIKVQLNPYWVTGFTDAEGTFTVVFDKINTRKLNWRIQPKFQISLHVRDLPLLLKVQQFFGNIGSVSESENMAFYSVSSVKDLVKTIIPHFLKYPLLTQKGADFILFKQIVDLMENKAHLTIEGINQIINIKAAPLLLASLCF